jgi:hypothetical protein
MSKIARVPIKGHDEKHVELVDYTPEEVDVFIRVHYAEDRRLPASHEAPGTLSHWESKTTPESPGGNRRAPKREAIAKFIQSLSASSGYAHTTEEVHKHFFGRRMSYVEDSEKQTAKTTGNNLRKAHEALSKQLGGDWISEMSGNRSAGATMRWKLEKK